FIVAERVPLWQVMSEWERTGLAATEVATLLSRQFWDAVEFLRTNLLGVSLTVCLFFFILIIASLLSRKVEQWTQDHPNFAEATHFLKRPVSLAMLVTLVLSLIFFAINAPRLLRGLEALLLLIPVLRLLPRLLHPAARPVFIGFAFFFFFAAVVFFFFSLLLLVGFFFFFLDIVAFAFLFWLLPLARVRRLSAETAPPAYLIFLFRIALLLIC